MPVSIRVEWRVGARSSRSRSGSVLRRGGVGGCAPVAAAHGHAPLRPGRRCAAGSGVGVRPHRARVAPCLLQPCQSVTAADQLLREFVTAGGAVLVVFGAVGLGRLAQDLRDLVLDWSWVRLAASAASAAGLVPSRATSRAGLSLRPDTAATTRPGIRPAPARGGHGTARWSRDPGRCCRQARETRVLMTVPLDLAGGTHAGRVAVQQHPQQHLGIVGGTPVPVRPVGGEERGLVDHIQDEPGQAVGGQPVAQEAAETAGHECWARSCRP